MRRLIILLCSCLLLSLSGCKPKVPPPDIEYAHNLYTDHKDAITTIVEFLLNSEYPSISILDSDGTMKTNSSIPGDSKLETVEISDLDAQKAINSLFDGNFVCYIYKSDEEIKFQIWRKNDVNCYIARSTKGNVSIVNYETDEYPMNEEYWYYVIADYNEWRVRQREAGVTRPTIGYGSDLSYWDILDTLFG